MSKNFELMRRGRKKLALQRPTEGEVRCVDSPAVRSVRSFPRNAENDTVDWLHLLSIIRKQWRWSALFAVVVMGTVTVVTLRMKSVYEPIATIEIDPPGEIFSLQGGSSGSDAEYLETQAKN